MSLDLSQKTQIGRSPSSDKALPNDREWQIAAEDQVSLSGAPYASRRHAAGLTPTAAENTRVKWL
jgi:hypothetical protein